MERFLCWLLGHPENTYSSEMPEGSTRLCPRCGRVLIKKLRHTEAGCGAYFWEILAN